MSDPDIGPDWEVPAALDGERIDRTVALLTGLTRSRAADLVTAGRVRLGPVGGLQGRPGPAGGLQGRPGPVGGLPPVRSGSRRVHRGERLRIDGDLPEDLGANPDDLPDASVTVPVVHVDGDVIVVDKPAGLVVHPGAGHSRGTLVQGLAAAYPDLVELARRATNPTDALRPGIVHRLDRGTSGLLVVARTELARTSLVAQLAARSAERRYRALAAGTLGSDEGLIDAPLGRSSSDPTRRAVRVDGRDARTTYVVLRRFVTPIPATLLHCRLETGRTHQIRVHLEAIGHPLIDDGRYGGPSPASAELGSGGDRPWLHAEILGFDHPTSGERLTFHSPLPDDLLDVLARFEEPTLAQA